MRGWGCPDDLDTRRRKAARGRPFCFKQPASGRLYQCSRASALHRAGIQPALVPRQCFRQQVRGVLAVALVAGTVEVVLQLRAEIRMRAVVDQYLRTLARGQPTQVGQALFGDDHRHVVLGVVDVAGHRHDRRNGAVLGGGRA
ncbi:hypothetical protein G6F66_014074 [Rhizopus arrhizus]|nr:hypothetical protein G6F66_014074 [Rhizopus arrhizus]